MVYQHLCIPIPSSVYERKTLLANNEKDGTRTWVAASVVHQEWTADELTVYIDNVPGRGEEE